jgi:hypothetical protein
VRRVTDTELQAAAYSSVTGRVICTVNRPVSFKKKPARFTGETGRFTRNLIYRHGLRVGTGTVPVYRHGLRVGTGTVPPGTGPVPKGFVNPGYR